MIFHKDLTQEKWENTPFFEQMANIGAEFGRAEKWSKKNKDLSIAALYRGIELLDGTVKDKKNNKKLKELLRLRELAADYFCFENIYKSTDKFWNDYFYPFNYAARINR